MLCVFRCTAFYGCEFFTCLISNLERKGIARAVLPECQTRRHSKTVNKMLLEQTKVKHKVFGEGVVISQNGKYFTVKFDHAQKVFVYPDVFEKFLTLDNGTLDEEIRADLDALHASKKQLIEEKNKENERAMARGIVIPGKEIPQETKEDDTRGGEAEEL